MENHQLINMVVDSDSYKFSHWKQYPPGATAMFSYLESRGGEYEKTLFFGLQYYIKEYLSKPVTMEMVDAAADFTEIHGVPFNYRGWKRIVEVHGGFLPVIIRAVPEGSIIPTGNIMMSVESTDPECFWVVSWIETMLVRLWYPITVATRSYYCKKTILEFLEGTSDSPADEIAFKLHDFGSRGVSSRESAMIGGAAHLVNFQGSDTVAGIIAANHYYNHEMAAFSIPATEHSTMTMWGKDREADAYANLLDVYQDQPIFACVSDSYDIYNAAKNIWGGSLRDAVKEYSGTLVIRPDSGEPAEVVVKLLHILEDRFGVTLNSKSYKVINNNVRVIQGDGINEHSMRDILVAVKENGYSTTNVTFGMGGGLLQQLDRDTCKFAFKCSWAEVNGVGVDVFKSPITDSGKNSKRGKLELEETPYTNYGGVRTVLRENSTNSLLRDVYRNGEVLVDDDLEAIRLRTGLEWNQSNRWTDRKP